MNRSSRLIGFAGLLSLCAAGAAIAQQEATTVDINKISAKGVDEKIGTVRISESKKVLAFAVAVTGIPAGPHGFHLHEKGDCGPGTKDGKQAAGLAAGSHYDPQNTKSHEGPKGKGHKGDLPVLKADAKGIKQTVTAPRLNMEDVRGRALMIHQGGDNYSNNPENGGGGGRVACGVVPKS